MMMDKWLEKEPKEKRDQIENKVSAMGTKKSSTMPDMEVIQDQCFQSFLKFDHSLYSSHLSSL